MSHLVQYNLFIFLFFYFFCHFVFLGPGLRHREVPKLGVESELQPPAYATATATQYLSCVFNLHHSSQQRQILNPRIEARHWTHIFMDASRVEPQQELLVQYNLVVSKWSEIFIKCFAFKTSAIFHGNMCNNSSLKTSGSLQTTLAFISYLFRALRSTRGEWLVPFPFLGLS